MPDRREAEALMKENFDSNPEFVEGYWFPNGDEFRFIYVDDTVVSSDAERPVPIFHLSGHAHPLKVGIVRTDEVRKLALPESWHQAWADGERILAPARTG